MPRFKMPDCVHKDCRVFVAKLLELLSDWEEIDNVILFGSAITPHFRVDSSDVDIILVTLLKDDFEFNKRFSDILYKCYEFQLVDVDSFILKSVDELTKPTCKHGLLADLRNNATYKILWREKNYE